MENGTNATVNMWMYVPGNRSQTLLEYLTRMQASYTKTSSITLTVLYIPTLFLSLVGNITALVVLVRTALNNYRMKTAFIINLVIADLSGIILEVVFVFDLKFRSQTIFFSVSICYML